MELQAATFSSAFSDAKNSAISANNSAPCKVTVNPWSLAPQFEQSEPTAQQKRSPADEIFAVNFSEVPQFNGISSNKRQVKRDRSVDSDSQLLNE